MNRNKKKIRKSVNKKNTSNQKGATVEEKKQHQEPESGKFTVVKEIQVDPITQQGFYTEVIFEEHELVDGGKSRGLIWDVLRTGTPFKERQGHNLIPEGEGKHTLRCVKCNQLFFEPKLINITAKGDKQECPIEKVGAQILLGRGHPQVILQDRMGHGLDEVANCLWEMAMNAECLLGWWIMIGELKEEKVEKLGFNALQGLMVNHADKRAEILLNRRLTEEGREDPEKLATDVWNFFLEDFLNPSTDPEKQSKEYLN